jgi:hypothetical protein
MDAPPSAPARGSAPSAAASTALCEPLRERMTAAGRTIGARESQHRAALEVARRDCAVWHQRVRAAIDVFHAEASAAGAPHLRLEVGEPRLDEKHVRAMEFEIRRGRHVGIVVVKTKGEVTLVGPFRTGKAEGPCRSLPRDADADIAAALGEFLERFVEEATTP